MDYIDYLRWNVKPMDILQLQDGDWALVIDRSSDDLEIVKITADNVLYATWIRISDESRFRINNNRVHLLDNEYGQEQHKVNENNIFHIMAHFLGNRSKKLLICSLKNELQRPDDETEEQAQLNVESLIDTALSILLGFIGSYVGDQVNQNSQKVSGWFDKNHIRKSEVSSRKELARELCVGDRLEFYRKCYRHWGIFLGQVGQALLVLHFSTAGSGKKYSVKSTSGQGSLAKDKPVYRIDFIEKPLGDHFVRINNSRDDQHKWKQLTPDAILDGIANRLSTQSLKKSPRYSIWNNNCEHLVNELRYHKHHSDQVRRPIVGHFLGAKKVE